MSQNTIPFEADQWFAPLSDLSAGGDFDFDLDLSAGADLEGGRRTRRNKSVKRGPRKSKDRSGKGLWAYAKKHSMKKPCKSGKSRRKSKSGKMRCVKKLSLSDGVNRLLKKNKCKDGKSRRKSKSGKMRCMKPAKAATLTKSGKARKQRSNKAAKSGPKTRKVSAKAAVNEVKALKAMVAVKKKAASK